VSDPADAIHGTLVNDSADIVQATIANIMYVTMMLTRLDFRSLPCQPALFAHTLDILFLLHEISNQ